MLNIHLFTLHDVTFYTPFSIWLACVLLQRIKRQQISLNIWVSLVPIFHSLVIVIVSGKYPDNLKKERNMEIFDKRDYRKKIEKENAILNAQRKDTMKYAYMKLPEGWDTYWTYRMVNSMTIQDAIQRMIGDGHTGWDSMDTYHARQLEIYTTNTIPCECELCLRGYGPEEGLDHRVPVKILAPHRYNEERSPNVRYSK